MKLLLPGLPVSRPHIRRVRTRDHMLNMDSAHRVSMTDHPGKYLGRTYKFRDGRTYDSTGAFLVGELERLDYTLHEPLVDISYMRDVPMRVDVTLADEVSSFTQSTYGSMGGLGTGNGIGN